MFKIINHLSVVLLTFALCSVSQAQNAKLYFNFGKNYTGTSPWNNAGADPVNGLTFVNLLDDSNNNTGISIQLLTDFGGLYGEGAITGNNSGVVPDNVLHEYYWFGTFGAPNETRFRVLGLIPGASYNLKFVGSSVFRGGDVTNNGNTIYSINGSSVSLYVDGNTNNVAQLNNVVADSEGQFEVVMTKDTNAPVGYINALIIDLPVGLYTPSGFTASFTPNTGVSLNWQDNNTSETGYEVYRAIGNGTFQLFTTLPANAVTHVDILWLKVTPTDTKYVEKMVLHSLAILL